MRPYFRVLTIVAAVAALMAPATGAAEASGHPAGAPRVSALTKSKLSMTRTDKQGRRHVAHYMATVKRQKRICPATCSDSGPLVYHSGGPIMPTTTTYTIFWSPATTQSGSATQMPTFYKNFVKTLAYNMGQHGLYNIATQYSQSGSLPLAYVQNISPVGGFYTDTDPYPAGGCSDTYLAHPTDCLTDAQLQAEITKVKGIMGWTGAINHLFFLYTSQNEGSCFDAGSSSCAYNQYCAYHSAYGPSNAPTVYANEPYGDPSVCLGSGTNPYNSTVVAAALTAASHEWMEAVTDPLLNAWYTAQGNENGDLCAYVYGTNTWDGGLANQNWNGHFFELQEEWSNHTNECQLVGP